MLEVKTTDLHATIPPSVKIDFYKATAVVSCCVVSFRAIKDKTKSQENASSGLVRG